MSKHPNDRKRLTRIAKRWHAATAIAVLEHGHRLPSTPPVDCARPEGLAELGSLGGVASLPIRNHG